MNLDKGEKFNLKTAVDYSSGGIISRQTVRNSAGSITLFAFDEGQFLSQHVSEFDSVIQIIEGEGNIYLGEKEIRLVEGEALIMPAHIPHALKAEKKFKMILTTIKG